MSAPIQPYIPKRLRPTHTHTALRVHSIEANKYGATVIWVAVRTERFRSVEDACASVEARHV